MFLFKLYSETTTFIEAVVYHPMFTCKLQRRTLNFNLDETHPIQMSEPIESSYIVCCGHVKVN